MAGGHSAGLGGPRVARGPPVPRVFYSVTESEAIRAASPFSGPDAQPIESTMSPDLAARSPGMGPSGTFPASGTPPHLILWMSIAATLITGVRSEKEHPPSTRRATCRPSPGC